MAKWGYGSEEGEEHWSKDFPAAAGNHQSPIDIIRENTVFDSKLEENGLHFAINSTVSKCQILHFTGHNFRIDTSEESMITTGVPGLETDEFKLVQFHFHWGNEEQGIGSEHKIDSKGWPSELHLVHYNSSKYSNVTEAADKPDGLTVLGVFIEIGEENEEIKHLIQPLQNLSHDKIVDLQPLDASLNLKNLLPGNVSHFFTYAGSLTTPPCSESVTWIVFEEPLTMSVEQLTHFRQLHNDECGTTRNNRSICQLNDREVKRSFDLVN